MRKRKKRKLTLLVFCAVLMVSGYWPKPQAAARAREWQVLGPVNLGIRTAVADAFYALGRRYVVGEGVTLNYHVAARLFRWGLLADPNNPPCRQGLGYMHKYLGRVDEAIEEFEAAVIYSSDNLLYQYIKVIALVNLAIIYEYDKHDYSNAKSLYRQVLEIDPDDEYARAGLTRIEAATDGR